MTFALFFLGEYANMLLMSAFASILFLGGWFPVVNLTFFSFFPGSWWFSWKIALGVAFFIITRATLPRYRYDQLMYIGWKSFLPLSVGYLLFTIGILISFNWLPT
jgi:NADH-quinone oxidoreductase subunit H